MNVTKRRWLSAMVPLSLAAMAIAQTPPAGRGGPPRPVLSVSSTAWADGAEVPMHNAYRGDNKSPAFEFHWSVGNTPGTAPDGLQTYAVIFHDVENSTNKNHRRHFALDCVQYSRNGQGIAGRIGNGRSPGWDSQRSGTCGAWKQSGRLFWTGRRPGSAASLRVRVLRSGYQAGFARQHDA